MSDETPSAERRVDPVGREAFENAVTNATGETPAERRVDRIGREAFDKAVVAATRAATQEVARVHRVRLVTQAGLVSFAVACVVFALAAYVVLNAISSSDAAGRQYNCRLVKSMSDTMSDFVTTDATLRAQEEALGHEQAVVTGENKLFGKTLVGRLLAQAHRVDMAAINHWRNQDVPRLKALAGVDCARVR